MNKSAKGKVGAPKGSRNAAMIDGETREQFQVRVRPCTARKIEKLQKSLKLKSLGVTLDAIIGA